MNECNDHLAGTHIEIEQELRRQFEVGGEVNDERQPISHT
jgi:hypothetical protein